MQQSWEFRNTAPRAESFPHTSSFIQRKISLNSGWANTQWWSHVTICDVLVHLWFEVIVVFQMFRKLHNSFTDVMCNPFHNPGDPIQSKWVYSFETQLYHFFPNLALLIVDHSFSRAFDGIVSGMMVQTGWHPVYPSFWVSTVQNTPYPNFFLLTCCFDNWNAK